MLRELGSIRIAHLYSWFDYFLFSISFSWFRGLNVIITLIGYVLLHSDRLLPFNRINQVRKRHYSIFHKALVSSYIIFNILLFLF